MQEHFEEVLRLQLAHSSEATPEMTRRGELVRNVIPDELRTWPAVTGTAILPFKGRLSVQGKDGLTRKTFVPWVRVYSPELSPSPQKGWYVVYLFRQDGAGVALSISHGSTRFDGRDFKKRSPEEAEALMDWARPLLREEAKALGFQIGVDLGVTHGVGAAYPSTTAFSKLYKTGHVPDDETLAADAAKAVSLLGQLYRADELGRSPETSSPEVVEMELAAEKIANPRRRSGSGQKGQGFGLTVAEKKLVEVHAMQAAKDWLSQEGFVEIKDVSAKQSCDFQAVRDGQLHSIEVKGTTGRLGSVLLTANEIELHREKHPHNLLLVVHDIDLLEMRSKASGGTTAVFDPWDVNAATLTPICYRVTVG